MKDINDISQKRGLAKMLAKDYTNDIKTAIKKIEYYKKHCGYDGTITIHDKELNELLDILKGGV